MNIQYNCPQGSVGSNPTLVEHYYFFCFHFAGHPNNHLLHPAQAGNAQQQQQQQHQHQHQQQRIPTPLANYHMMGPGPAEATVVNGRTSPSNRSDTDGRPSKKSRGSTSGESKRTQGYKTVQNANNSEKSFFPL